MSPNSIVKDYNLEFRLPSGNIGNMYAINAMSHGDNIFSVKDNVIDTQNINNIDDDSRSIIYNPDLGDYRVKQTLDEKNESAYYNVYNQMKKLTKSDTYEVSTIAVDGKKDYIEGEELIAMRSSEGVETKKKPNIKKKKRDTGALIKGNDEALQINGAKVVQSFTDYYKYLVTDDVNKIVPRLLPYTLSLTTYGISSVQPGDTFKVDYLPQMYLKNTYLQIVKVMNEIGSDGWYTSFDTQFRLKSTVKTVEKGVKQPVYLSGNVIKNLGLDDFLSGEGFKSNEFGDDEKVLDVLVGYMVNFRPKVVNGFDLAIDFRTTNNIKNIVSTNTTAKIINNKKFNPLFIGDSLLEIRGINVIFKNEKQFNDSLPNGLSKSDFKTIKGKQYQNFRRSLKDDVEIPSRNADDYQFHVCMPDVDIKSDPKKLTLFINGGDVAIYDNSKPPEKTTKFLSWWSKHLGKDYINTHTFNKDDGVDENVNFQSEESDNVGDAPIIKDSNSGVGTSPRDMPNEEEAPF